MKWQKQVSSIVTGRMQDSENTRWKVPEASGLKLNVDVSVRSGTDSFAVGMIIRDDIENFI